MFETLTFSNQKKLMYRFQHFKFLLSDHVCFRVFFQPIKDDLDEELDRIVAEMEGQ